MKILVSILLNAISIYIGSVIISGVYLSGFFAAFIAGLILGIANFTIKPILNILALPITFLTLGFFILVINAIVLLLVSYFVPGFSINGFFAAFLLGLLIIILNLIYSTFNLRR